MTKAKTNKHLEAAAAYIAVAESGDAKREAYKKAADEILAALAEDPKLTQKQVAGQIGRREPWVSELLTWRKVRVHELPFAQTDRQVRYRERQVPTQHEDRVEMATKLLADPKVAKTVAPVVTDRKTKAGRELAKAVWDKDAEERAENRKWNQERRAAGALPLPAYMAKMVEKINEWGIELAALVDDLDTLPEGPGRDSLVRACRGTAKQLERWIERLEAEPADVIEGQFSIADELESKVGA
jgi:hypothetical protein